MQISIKNIGKIKNAIVNIDSITVIAGENNTGKSTIGKTLFAIFNSFCDVQRQIRHERESSIRRALLTLYIGALHADSDFDEIKIVGENLLKLTGEVNEEDIKREILKHINKEIVEDTIDGNMLKEICYRIKDILTVSNNHLLNSILNKNLQSEFNDQICNIFTKELGEVKLKIKEAEITVDINEDRVSEIENKSGLSLHTEVIYIDDPFVLDDIEAMNSVLSLPFFTNKSLPHRRHLEEQLFWKKGRNSLIDQILIEKKFKTLYMKLSSICSGSLVRKGNKGFFYKKDDNDVALDVRNLSAGLKTFVILKTLIDKGLVENNGTVILDEPEIHLHPKWQLIFAELIVLLQKEFKLHILLNTHSPYFLRAIQVYSAKYGIADTCKYYLAEVKNNQSVIEDITENIDKAYQKLAQPLQVLADEEWAND